MTGFDASAIRYAWGVLRDQSRIGSNTTQRNAHVLMLLFEDHRMATCGTALDGRAWTQQTATDPTRRCGRCEEAERNHLTGRVESRPS